ncbi:hypothetical protein F511_30615 [Dorcoceras hygrometricum]|uniref:Uncharacterized protein n=1 Tax=Dorcoceras hygrometricum TaxID=472368 RepID=A0A2Z7BJ93_9LAMI|nr:hypothetical protein F511_30615 [Dorcoceras hygrometricum]
MDIEEGLQNRRSRVRSQVVQGNRPMVPVLQPSQSVQSSQPPQQQVAQQPGHHRFRPRDRQFKKKSGSSSSGSGSSSSGSYKVEFCGQCGGSHPTAHCVCVQGAQVEYIARVTIRCCLARMLATMEDPDPVSGGAAESVTLLDSRRLAPTKFAGNMALQGLTNLARTESPQHDDRNKSDHDGGGTAARRWRRRPRGFWGGGAAANLLGGKPALEGLTNLARTESPQHDDRNKSDHDGGGTAARRWRRRPRGFWGGGAAANLLGGKYLCDPQWFRDTASRGPHNHCDSEITISDLPIGSCTLLSTHIPIRSTTIGKSRVARDPIAIHTSWRSNSDIASVTRVSMTFRVVRTNQYNQDLGLIHSTNGNHLESPNEGSSIDHHVTIHLHAQNITMFPTNETWYFTSQMLVSSSGGLILILTAQSTRNEFRIHSDY